MLPIKFALDKNGKKIAYRFSKSFAGGRYIKMNLIEAEILLATGKAYIFEI
jgi:hypothetical protein